MKTLLNHLFTHLVVSLGLINAGHLLFNVGDWVASQDWVSATTDQM